MNHEKLSNNVRHTKDRDALLQAAERTIRAVWNWNYLDWEALAPYLTGQLAALFRANVASSESEVEDIAPIRDLTDLALDIHSFEKKDKAMVLAHYSWSEHGTAGSESVVWVFVKEDGAWKASGIGRESYFAKTENSARTDAPTDGAQDKNDI